MSDEEGMFVTSLEVGRIGADSADKYECSPSPGSTALARVHVITEGENITNTNIKFGKVQILFCGLSMMKVIRDISIQSSL